MIRPRIRALMLIMALMLVAPLIAGMSTTRTLAQDATPVAVGDLASPPLAEAMPVGTSVYLATEFGLDNEQYLELSALLARLVIPGAGDTISAVVEQLTQLLASIPSDLTTVLDGEVGIGLSGLGTMEEIAAGATSMDPESMIGSLLPSAAIVLHPLEAGTARELVEEWFDEQVAQAGGQVQRSQAGSIVVLRNTGVDATDGNAPGMVIFSGDYILFGDDYESLLPYVETTQGNEPSLANSDELNELNGGLPADRLLFGYLDAAILLEAAGSLEMATIDLSSVDLPFGTTAFTVTADAPGLRLESASKPAAEAGSPADSSGVNPDFAASVPETTLALLAGQDLGQSWLSLELQDVLLSTLAGALGAGDIDLSEFEVEEQFGFISMLTGINFKTDLIDQLEGNYRAALFSLDMDNPLASSAVIASDLEDPDRVSVAVTSLGPLIQSSGAGTASVTTASVQGQTVNNVAIATDGLNATIQYGVVDDQLMVGLGDGVDVLAGTQGTSLETSPGYQAALEQLPSVYDGMLYVDLQAIVEDLSPLIFDALADNDGNALVQCLTGSDRPDADATPSAELNETNGGGWIAEAGCSIVSTLVGGEGALFDLLISRVPGPLVAVGYNQDGLQRVSGILLVGSIDS